MASLDKEIQKAKKQLAKAITIHATQAQCTAVAGGVQPDGRYAATSAQAAATCESLVKALGDLLVHTGI